MPNPNAKTAMSNMRPKIVKANFSPNESQKRTNNITHKGNIDNKNFFIISPPYTF